MSYAAYVDARQKLVSLTEADVERIGAEMAAADPAGGWAAALWGDFRLGRGQGAEAFERYVQALARHPGHLHLCHQAGQALRVADLTAGGPGEPDEGAMAGLASLEDLTRTTVLARFFYLSGSLGRATRLYWKLFGLTRNPAFDQMHREALFRQDDFTGLIDRVASKVIHPGAADALFDEATRLLAEGELEKAIRGYERVAALEPSSHFAFFMIGAISYHQFHIEWRSPVLQRALTNLTKAVQLSGASAEYRFYYAMALTRVFENTKAPNLLNGIVDLLRGVAATDPDFILPQYGQPTFSALDRITSTYMDHYQDRPTALGFYRTIKENQDRLLQQHPLARVNIRTFSDYDLGPIGHAVHLEIFVRMCRLGLCPPYLGVLLVRNPYRVANRALLDYWKAQCADHLLIATDIDQIRRLRPMAEAMRIFKVRSALSPDPVANPDGNIAAGIWGISNYQFDVPVPEVLRRWDAAGRGPLLRTTPEHHERGWQALGRFGLQPGEWFACLHVRERGFLGDLPMRHLQLRDSDIDTYLPAIQSVVRRGGWVIRIGDRSMKPLPPMERVIDYALSDLKSDWMDVFLWGQCRFYIGTPSGPLTTVSAFDKPRVVLNTLLSAAEWLGPGEVAVPKIYVDRRSGRALKYTEMFGNRVRESWLTERIRQGEIDFIDNTPEEIEDGVEQLMDNIFGLPPLDAAQRARQEGFDALARRSGTSPFLVGRKFLENHPEMC